ncbi:ABC-type cobalt transport system,permease component [Candidatus Phytoplasma australiense]|uniref:ABC-type cobalt transport system,permease component n=1 Tax=Phytoplasma australiense TaxID=59748 RepID=B1V976_PHYAS|nr:ABC-type cobalt transport system,permease component [Candidatus Phytoplasma australiense]
MKKKDLEHSLRHNHPSIKIMAFLLLLFFVLQLPINNHSNLKMWTLYASVFCSLLLICFSFGLSFCYFCSRIKHLRFFFFISLLLQLTTTKNNFIEIEIVNYHYALAILFFCFFFYSLTQKKIHFKLSYLLIILFLVFVFPVYFRSDITTTYYLKISSFLRIVLIITRLIMIMMLFFLFNKIIYFNEINDGLQILLSPLKKIKIPIQTFALMLSLIFMAHSFLLQETKKILKAQISRGMNLNNKNIFKKVNHLLSLLVPIFILVFKRSIVLSDAMEVRGYVLGGKRTKMNIYRLQLKDFFLMFVVCILFLIKYLCS